MSKLREIGSRAVRKSDPVEIEPVTTSQETGPWFQFRHSYTEVSAIGGSTRVRRRETRFENGRLTSESFEGTLGQGAYDHLAAEAQKLFVSQTAFLLKQLALFLPFPGGPSRRKD